MTELEIGKEYPLKGGGKMVPKVIGTAFIHGDYIRPDVEDGGKWRASLWHKNGKHFGFGHQKPDPLLDMVMT